MDSQDKNKLTDRLREEALAQRMGKALDRLSSDDTRECPDAEILAAYQEHALDPAEGTLWEGHFARCSRCRKILAVLSASVEAPLAESEIARLGESVGSGTRTVQAVPSRKIKPIRPSTWDWRVRWLAPALGVAAALAMWFAIRPPWRAKNPDSSGTLIAQAPRNEALPPAELRSLDRFSSAGPKKKEAAVAAPAAPSTSDQSILKNPPATPAAPPSDKDGAKNGNAVAELSPNAGRAQNALRDEKQNRSELDVVPAPAPPPAPQAQARIASGAREAAGTASSTAQTATVPEETPSISTAQGKPVDSAAPQSASNELMAVQPANGQPMRARAYGALAKAAGAPGGAIVVKAPSGTLLWRAGSRGNIQRSSDGGATWISQESPSQEDWLAGSAASETACWLVGRNGAIARTTDGQRWETIAPPPSAASAPGKFPDWTGITVRKADTATITAGDQRRYATQDGGKTWRTQ
jgi:hypothetical protein